MGSLRAARDWAGFVRSTVASHIGVCERTIIRFEAERRPETLPYIHLEKLADLYGCSIPQLLGRAPLPARIDEAEEPDHVAA